MVKSLISTPFIIHCFIIYLCGNTVFPWAFHYGYQMLSTRIQLFFILPAVLFSVVQPSIWPTQSWNEPHRSWLLFLRTVRWSWIPKTPRTVLMLVLYNCPKQSEKWIKNYQFNLCALNTLFIISSGLQQTLGPRSIFPSKYILFNVQPKEYSCFFNT